MARYGRAADPRIQPYRYEVQVRNGIDIRDYLNSLVQGMGAQGGISTDIVEQSSEDSSFPLLDGVIAALALVLIAIAVAGVFNTVILTMREKVGDVAILKAVGMAPQQVVAMVIASVPVSWESRLAPFCMVRSSCLWPGRHRAATSLPVSSTSSTTACCCCSPLLVS